VAQKFEYTFELCWKCIKDFLKRQEGIDEATPKKIIKAFYLAGYAIEDDYLALLRAVDDRNLLSHIYNEATFAEILARIPEHARLIGRVIPVFENEKPQG
jgi:nucleotidyltransferase substrate binding protein (TIGR01987 family)